MHMGIVGVTAAAKVASDESQASTPTAATPKAATPKPTTSSSAIIGLGTKVRVTDPVLAKQAGREEATVLANFPLQGKASVRLPGDEFGSTLVPYKYLEVDGVRLETILEKEREAFATGKRGVKLTDNPLRLEFEFDGESYPTANKLATKEERETAGTPQAAGYKRTIEGVGDLHLEGPSVYDPSTLPDRPAGWLQSLVVKWVLRDVWGIGEKSDLRQIQKGEMVALTEGVDPKLKPGDFICNGAHGELGHLVMYLGKDEKGVPMIIHAMATKKEGRRNILQRGWDLMELEVARLRGKPEKIGVIKEPLAEFFEAGPQGRFFRDTYVVGRIPRFEPDEIAAGIAHIKTLEGMNYDSTFSHAKLYSLLDMAHEQVDHVKDDIHRLRDEIDADIKAQTGHDPTIVRKKLEAFFKKHPLVDTKVRERMRGLFGHHKKGSAWCSWMLYEFVTAACAVHNKPLPRFGTTHYSEAIKPLARVEAWVFEPESAVAAAVSGDVKITAANESGKKAMRQVIQTTVVDERGRRRA
jgi:hypothetical protein